MVKQAEKIDKRSPFAPIFGLVLALGCAAIAGIVAHLLVIEGTPIKIDILMRAGRVASQRMQVLVATGFGIWLVLLAVVYFVVVLSVGRDPKSVHGMKLPTRTVKKKQDLWQ
jgi:hypothetical protein